MVKLEEVFENFKEIVEEERFFYLPEGYYLEGPNHEPIFPKVRSFRIVKEK